MVTRKCECEYVHVHVYGREGGGVMEELAR